MMALADPTDPEHMYLNPDGGVPLARPMMTGDVFTDVPCARGGSGQTVMVLTHPCSMRSGKGELREIVTIGTVVDSPQPRWRGDRWSSGQFDYLPLNDVPGPGATSAVHFTDLHAADSSDLDLDKRVVGLSEYGIAVLLQRWIYQLSRVPVVLPELTGLIAPILAEAEIEEDWTQTAIDLAVPADDIAEVMRASTARVQEILGHGENSLRARLAAEASRPGARRAVAQVRAKELGR